jgi:hypothetical protein
MFLVCPKCTVKGVIRLDLDDGDTLTCMECDEGFSFNDVKAMIASWGPIIPWLDSHPARGAE